MPKVFVYGTLKRGYGNHRVMEAAEGEFLQKDTIKGYEIYNTGCFPAVVEGEGVVQGEVFEVPEEGMYFLDRLEGVPRLYDRHTTHTEGGLEVVTYLWQSPVHMERKLEERWP
jgi:gamma-glutamylcyclotransferase (GGCT)/AIG2-like uncharacterized protein YtfP